MFDNQYCPLEGGSWTGTGNICPYHNQPVRRCKEKADIGGVDGRKLMTALDRLAVGFESADPKVRCESKRIGKVGISDIAKDIDQGPSIEDLQQRRARCYEFENVVPWEEIIADMEEETDG